MDLQPTIALCCR